MQHIRSSGLLTLHRSLAGLLPDNAYGLRHAPFHAACVPEKTFLLTWVQDQTLRERRLEAGALIDSDIELIDLAMASWILGLNSGEGETTVGPVLRYLSGCRRGRLDAGLALVDGLIEAMNSPQSDFIGDEVLLSSLQRRSPEAWMGGVLALILLDGTRGNADVISARAMRLEVAVADPVAEVVETPAELVCGVLDCHPRISTPLRVGLLSRLKDTSWVPRAGPAEVQLVLSLLSESAEIPRSAGILAESASLCPESLPAYCDGSKELYFAMLLALADLQRLELIDRALDVREAPEETIRVLAKRILKVCGEVSEMEGVARRLPDGILKERCQFSVGRALAREGNLVQAEAIAQKMRDPVLAIGVRAACLGPMLGSQRVDALQLLNSLVASLEPGVLQLDEGGLHEKGRSDYYAAKATAGVVEGIAEAISTTEAESLSLRGGLRSLCSHLSDSSVLKAHAHSEARCIWALLVAARRCADRAQVQQGLQNLGRAAMKMRGSGKDTDLFDLSRDWAMLSLREGWADLFDRIQGHVSWERDGEDIQACGAANISDDGIERKAAREALQRLEKEDKVAAVKVLFSPFRNPEGRRRIGKSVPGADLLTLSTSTERQELGPVVRLFAAWYPKNSEQRSRIGEAINLAREQRLEEAYAAVPLAEQSFRYDPQSVRDTVMVALESLRFLSWREALDRLNRALQNERFPMQSAQGRDEARALLMVVLDPTRRDEIDRIWTAETQKGRIDIALALAGIDDAADGAFEALSDSAAGWWAEARQDSDRIGWSPGLLWGLLNPGPQVVAGALMALYCGKLNSVQRWRLVTALRFTGQFHQMPRLESRICLAYGE